FRRPVEVWLCAAGWTAQTRGVQPFSLSAGCLSSPPSFPLLWQVRIYLFLNAMLGDAIHQSFSTDVYKARGLRLIPIKLAEGLNDQLALDCFETESFAFEGDSVHIEILFRERRAPQARRQIGQSDFVGPAQQNDALD